MLGCIGESLSLFFSKFYPFFLPNFVVSHCLVATILSHRYNSRTGSGETKVESHASSDTQPNQAALLLNTEPSNPEASRTNVLEETPCTWQPWLVRTAPGPPQESLMRNETKISLPAKPSLTRTTLGQLCVAPWTSRANPESLVVQLTLQYSALSHCATREAQSLSLK